MKTLQSIKKTELDYSKPQWVISNDQIVLTTGVHSGYCFSGTSLPCENEPYGSYSTDWSKSSFSLLEGTVMFPVSND